MRSWSHQLPDCSQSWCSITTESRRGKNLLTWSWRSCPPRRPWLRGRPSSHFVSRVCLSFSLTRDRRLCRSSSLWATCFRFLLRCKMTESCLSDEGFALLRRKWCCSICQRRRRPVQRKTTKKLSFRYWLLLINWRMTLMMKWVNRLMTLNNCVCKNTRNYLKTNTKTE